VRPLRVVVSGSECTGKTTLASELAARLGAPWSPEAARAYAERVARELTADDVEPIAREQIGGEDAAEARAASGLLVCDTDLVSTVVYARHYYGACPAWIETAARERRGDLYLLLRPDVPWRADGVRDRPRVREELHALFEAALRASGARVVTIGGAWDERRAAAVAAVAALPRDRPGAPRTC
jgi:NadR type nicotinamide-nucleotide adenylyltransferase